MGWYARMAQCEGKISFETWDLAEQIARRRKRKGKKGKPYRCPHCGEYHIGSRPKRSRGYENEYTTSGY